MTVRNMGTRLGAALVLLGALAACLAVSVGEATPARSGCNARDSRTVLRSGGVRVYRVRGAVYGCVESSGATKKLSPQTVGRTGAEIILGKPFAANAPWVAGVLTHTGPKGETAVAVRARNLNLGDVTPTCRLAVGAGRKTPEIDRIVVEKSGIFAWSGYEAVWIQNATHEQEEVFRPNVFACVSGGRHYDPQTLDSFYSEVVKVGSLTLDGKTLEWERANGERCRALLRRPSLSLPPFRESATGCSKPYPF